MTGTVLVTDGDERSALAVVRSLGQAGYRVVVAARHAESLAGASRYAAARAAVPDPLHEPARFADAIVALARTDEVARVLPIGEAALLALLERRDDLPDGAIPWPALDSVRAICDKAQVLDAAIPCGIRVPAQRILHDRHGDVAGLQFPVVVKPSRSVAGEAGARAKLRVAHAASAGQLSSILESLPDVAFPVLVQERIVGPGIGIFLLVWDGVVRAVFSHRRIREKPPAGGVSVYRESIAADPALVEKSVALLARFGWQGVAMVEYKVDAATGTPVLMEVNGRFWGSLQLAIDAGVNFPVLLLQCAEGRPPLAPPAYRDDVRLRWWWGEVDHLLARLRHSDAALGLPPGSPGRLAAIADFLRRDPRDRAEVNRPDDPLPARHERAAWWRRA